MRAPAPYTERAVDLAGVMTRGGVAVLPYEGVSLTEGSLRKAHPEDEDAAVFDIEFFEEEQYGVDGRFHEGARVSVHEVLAVCHFVERAIYDVRLPEPEPGTSVRG